MPPQSSLELFYTARRNVSYIPLTKRHLAVESN
jgi:hypothetical protein